MPTRVALRLSYDGTDFNGWQSQAPGKAKRTVQGAVEAGLALLFDVERVAVVAAGRTDTGVHARAQVVSAALPRAMALEELGRALNAVLPRDVRVTGITSVGDDFDARRAACSKLYRYVLDTALVQSPLRRRYAGHAPGALNHDAVFAAAALFLGRHDFASLASAGGSVQTTVRTVTRSEARFEDDVLIYEVEASGFLRKMVRSMVGGLLAAGRGTHDREALQAALEGRDRRLWPAPIAARGLTLERVSYEPPLEFGW